MKKRNLFIFVVLIILIFTGCSSNKNRLKESPCACNEVLDVFLG